MIKQNDKNIVDIQMRPKLNTGSDAPVPFVEHPNSWLLDSKLDLKKINNKPSNLSFFCF